MPDVTVRPAGQPDLEALVRLMATVQAPHAAALPGVFRAALDERAARTMFAKALGEDKVFVAERAGMAAGYLWLAFVERSADAAMRERRYAYINHVGVALELRGKGVGRALVRAARGAAAAQGVAEIGVDWWHFNTDAAGFFARMGFEAQRHVAVVRL